MNTYTVTDSVGRDHTVRADRYEPATGPGGDACIINYHFFAGGTRVASFLNPRAVTTTVPGSAPDIVRTRASFTVNGYPADVALRLKQWAAEHMWTISDLATVTAAREG